MHSYTEQELRTRVDAALQRIRTVLENNRNPHYAADVPHRYEDKYLLAEFLTRATVAALVQCLEVVGVTSEQFATMREWAQKRSVTLRLAAQENCNYLREETRKVEGPNETVTETRGLLGNKITRTEKVVTNVTEHFWDFHFRYEITAYPGNEPEKSLAIHSRSGSTEIKTAAKTTPRPKSVVRPTREVNITWLLQHLDAELRATFTIDRADAQCHTPRRNPQVEEALRAISQFADLCAGVESYFVNELFPAQEGHGRDLGMINPADVFVPVLPLFEARGEGVLLDTDLNALLAEERRTLAEKCRAISAAFPRDASVVTAVEASLLVTLMHAARVCEHYAAGVDYIENMLRKQLVAAIGKEVTAADFTSYMEFHHKKLVKPEYRPLPFSYAIRRPDHDPEGVLSIEAERGTSMADPISTTVAHSEAARPMHFALDASTRVAFLGQRHLHAWISHQFSGQPAPALQLAARARQFSSFILLVGRIASADTFEPRYGVIVQNKDLLKIPLLLEQLPTPKEFRDAIESLSPEQQRFARAFRGMQLESTLFGVCVIQIKPQLETLLKLPPDSLTKEIKLTQELLNLFIEYQIPSDLLSYDGPPEAATAEKLARVKEYVARMLEMIALSKKREIEQEQEREALRRAEMNQTPVLYAALAEPMPAPSGMAFGGGGPMAMPVPGPGAMPFQGGPPPAPPAMRASTGSAQARPAAPPPAPSPPPQSAPVPQASTPAPVTKSASTPQRNESSPRANAGDSAPTAGDGVDYTRIPTELDKKFERLDEDSALRATIINPGDVWTRTAQKGLLSAPATNTLGATETKLEKNRAFDLLDALTKSGALAIEDASLHVVIAATHRFDRTLLDTVIEQNVNPIEKVERSLMIVGTTIHRTPAAQLLADDQRDRFFTASPGLLGDGSEVK